MLLHITNVSEIDYLLKSKWPHIVRHSMKFQNDPAFMYFTQITILYIYYIYDSL